MTDRLIQSLFLFLAGGGKGMASSSSELDELKSSGAVCDEYQLYIAALVVS